MSKTKGSVRLYVKNDRFLCVIAGATTYAFATVGKANVQKTLLFLTALL
ncbi:hypothetical protein P7M46_07730 [Bisgaard Taxon 10/6]|uniref:Uncharacterized protein n=1 Tax=Exercitatus varius TaxID=67857 RepID=A0AAW6QC38_9PAST|nr:hypothetical protein [Exercitatus varius]MDG2917882.1 hypothetical protein [Exercitatus varius]MDG2949693.1 hypothetical protein [Exercitatus varius]